jgi:hypothetical protein
MPKSVDRYLAKLTSKGMPKSEAIAIGKTQGKIVQKGAHLGAGPKAKGGSRRGK